jgi:predicted DCC family thiol-disulfide oxidoreductase YuxK
MQSHHTDYPLTLLYDGACPICKTEMDRLARRDSLHRLVFVDISEAGFDATRFGATLEEMQRLIHAVRADGTLVIGVEALRLAYGAVGLGVLLAPAALPGLKPLFERAYALFARYRYGVSAVACATGMCETPKERKAS